MSITLASAILRYGQAVKSKLASAAVSGQPEEQLRKPLEDLFENLAELCGKSRACFFDGTDGEVV